MASDKNQRLPAIDGRFDLVMGYVQRTRHKVQAQLAELVAETRLLEEIMRETAKKARGCNGLDQSAAVREFMEYTGAAIGHCHEVLARMDGLPGKVLVVKVPVPVRRPPEPSIN